jgi:hypothetical protein
LVISFHVVPQGRFQFLGAAIGAAAELPFRQGGEPTLDQIDPGGSGGSEVQMIARMTHQPALNQPGLVRAIVIQNQMHVQFRRGGSIDRVQKAAELDGAMATMTLANDFAAGHLQSCKQRGGAVPFVVVKAMRRAHFIPEDKALWYPSRFGDFLEARCQLIAKAATHLLKPLK